MAGDAMVWAAQNGLVMGYSGVQKEGQVQGSGIQVVMAHAPVSIIPTKLPKDQVRLIFSITPHLGHKTSPSPPFSRPSLQLQEHASRPRNERPGAPCTAVRKRSRSGP